MAAILNDKVLDFCFYLEFIVHFFRALLHSVWKFFSGICYLKKIIINYNTCCELKTSWNFLNGFKLFSRNSHALGHGNKTTKIIELAHFQHLHHYILKYFFKFSLDWTNSFIYLFIYVYFFRHFWCNSAGKFKG